MANTRNRKPQETTVDPDQAAEPTSDSNGSRPALPSLDAMEDSEVSLAELRRTPNPYAGITRDPRVLDADKPKRLPVTDREQGKQVMALLRRDATAQKVGLSVDVVERDGGVYVVFRSKSTKRKLEHTSDVIREWAIDQRLPTEIGETTNSKGELVHSSRLPAATRDAYRKAHGLPTVKR